MKKVLLNFYRCIVGSEYGWTGEGNTQWYYFLALVINCMLTWWFKPELGTVFTVAAVIHFITVAIYGYEMLSDSQAWYSFAYYAIHIVLFLVCAFFNWKWAILTSLIVIVAFFLAPDCTGNNIIMRPPENYTLYCGVAKKAAILAFHTIIFAIFVVIAINLPISLWKRIIIIVVCMVLHPIIDLIEGECIEISDSTIEAFEKIVETFTESKDPESI